MYVVCVDFDIKPDQMDAFVARIGKHAQKSLEVEPECLVFDVCRPENTDTAIFLYEVYASRAGFEAHLASDHLAAFEADAVDMIAHKSVRMLTRI